LEVLQQQRLEFEGILQRRLLEQEHEMISQTNAKLQEKDSAVKDMIDKAIEKLGEEHENEKKALMDRADQEIKSHYEQMFSQKLEELKTGTMDEMERKVQAIEALGAKLKDLEDALASTKDFHEGSQQAHRLSAAALALAEKMESNKGAGAELNALKVCRHFSS
jgi:adenine specific DNA methylase Mod